MVCYLNCVWTCFVPINAFMGSQCIMHLFDYWKPDNRPLFCRITVIRQNIWSIQRLIFHHKYSTFPFTEIFPLLKSINYITLSFTFWCPISFSIDATELKLWKIYSILISYYGIFCIRNVGYPRHWIGYFGRIPDSKKRPDIGWNSGIPLPEEGPPLI